MSTTLNDSAPAATMDVLTARHYTHPALDGQSVVRLVPGTLGEAEDLALEFLGLERVGDPVQVGQVRQEALGFPAWALVHDRANGHHALALVKEMERLARQARTKPGAAKDGFEALAAQLGRTVPHFLPTFLEQVGRIMLEIGNQTYASSFFGKAREAERVHNLELDEDRLRAVFLEFALGGALTVKALRQYVKDLGTRLDGASAWVAFRQLCVERSAAGMAPYAGLAEDARGLLKRSGLTQAEAVAAEQDLLLELLAAPSITRAPAAFWGSWRTRLVGLARADAAVRARLLELLPTPSGEAQWRRTTFTEPWLEVLAVSGADLLLTGPSGPDSAPGAPAAWLSRWAGHLVRGWGDAERSPGTLGLVQRMAARLRADAVPVELFAGVPQHRYATQLDVLDLLLEAEVPVVLPPALLAGLALAPWLEDRSPGARELVAVAADPRLRPVLRRAVGNSRVQHNGHHSKPVLDVPVLAELLGEWIDEQVLRLESSGGLAGAQEVLAALRSWHRQIREIRPEAAERIAALNVSALLARTLRAGIVDELGWPALEQGLTLLGEPEHHTPGLRTFGTSGPPHLGTQQNGTTLDEAWPALVLQRDDHVAVVGPQGVLLEHQARIPTRATRPWMRQFRFADGELLVTWLEDNRWRGYWSGRPQDVFEVAGKAPEYAWNGFQHLSLPLPGAGRTSGGRPLVAGDTLVPRRLPVRSDGVGFWVAQDGANSRGTWLEYDPGTGARGRVSLPSVLSASEKQCDLPLVTEHCEVLPLQPGQEDTPLGTDGTLLGHWVRRDATRVVIGTPDGRMAELPAVDLAGNGQPVGLLRLPGNAELLVVQTNNRLTLFPCGDGAPDHQALATLAVADTGGLYAGGTPRVLAPGFWHNLRPRDEQGSLALRSLTDARAAELLAAARPREHAEGEEQVWVVVAGVRLPRTRPEPVPTAEVEQLLPEITHPLLRAGVAGLVLGAVAVAESAASFRPQPDAADSGRPTAPARKVPEYRPELGDDYRIRLLTEVHPQYLVRPGVPDWTTLDQIRSVASAFTTAPAAAPAAADGWIHGKDRIPTSQLSWLPLLRQLPQLTLRAVSSVSSPDQRETLRLLLTELLRLPLGTDPESGATLREVVLTEPLSTGGYGQNTRVGQIMRRGDRTVVFLAHHSWRPGASTSWLALDQDPSESFTRIGHFAVDTEQRVTVPIDPARLLSLLERAAADGPVPWRPEAALEFAERTGLGLGQAALVLAGLPSVDELGTLALSRSQEPIARARLHPVPTSSLARVAAALVPDRLERLWQAGPDLDAAAEAWTSSCGRRTLLPEETAATVNGARLETIDALLNPQHTPWLTRTTTQRLVSEQHGKNSFTSFRPLEHGAVPPGHRPMSDIVEALRWLAYHLPDGNPVRALLPQALQSVRARLADPGLLLDPHIGFDEKGKPTAPAMRAAFGAPEAGGAGPDGIVRLGEAVALVPEYNREGVYVRPAGFDGPDDPAFTLLEGAGGPYGATEIVALRAILGTELEQLLAAGTAPTEVPRHAQDASTSVPQLVGEVARARGLSADSAALYLMLLALPDPTDRHVAAWTGWKPARLKAARADLLAADGLVVEAKRARAGRTLFLPGGWQESRSPGIPMETWKAGLYPLSTRFARWPALPVPELFARAWQRVLAGETPGYEQPVTPATRRTGTRKATR